MSDERKDHKYVARVPLKNSSDKKKKWRYFYTQAEYRAYLKGLKEHKKDDDKTKSTPKPNKTLLDMILNKSKKALDKASSTIEKTADKGKKALDKATSAIEKNVDKVEKKVKKTFTNLSKKIEKGKTEVNKYLAVNGNKKTSEVGVQLPKINKAKQFISNVLNEGIGVAVTVKAAEIMAEIGKPKAKKHDEKLPELELKDDDEKKQTDDEDMALVNPNYKNGKDWTTANNCAYCTAAYDLRQRGYDVEAAEITPYQANNIYEIAGWYENADVRDFSDVVGKDSATVTEVTKALEKEMSQYGDGARGHLCIYWAAGGGHDVIWEVEGDDVVIRDCQTNEKLDVNDYMQYAGDFMYFRSDNLEPSEEIYKTVKNRR